jgi:hypothetical protein
LDTNGTVRLAVLHRVLDVDQAPDVEGLGDGPGVAFDHLDRRRRERRRRDHAGAVAGVDTRLLDVLHDRPDHDSPGGVSNGIDVDLDGIFEEAVDKDGPLG